MKKKTVFIFFISIHLILFFLPRQATAFNNETFLESDKSESIEELFSKISSSFPHVSDEYAIELAEAIYLMNQLKYLVCSSDKEGKFSMGNITPGRYKVGTSASGMALDFQPITEIVVKEGKDIDNLKLTFP